MKIINERNKLKRQKKWATRFTIISGIVLAITAILQFNATSELVKLNERLIEQERKFNSPVLTNWFVVLSNSTSTNDLVSKVEGHHTFIRHCLRNDGRVSTGPVLILPSNFKDNFTFFIYREGTRKSAHPFFDNIPPGEGNCTDLSIWYKPCIDTNCSSDLVPNGIQIINTRITCELCDDREKLTNITFCLIPSDECK